MITFLLILVTGFFAYSVGFKIGALSTLSRLSAISREMQSILDDLQKQRNYPVEGSWGFYFDNKGLRYKESP